MSAPRTFQKDSTSKTVYVMLHDSVTFLGKTGLVFGDITGSYVRPLGSRQSITMATQTVTGAYSSGGFVEIDATNQPGLYRFDLPDAALATGVVEATVSLKATGVLTDHTTIYLTDYDPNAAGASEAAIADAVWDEARAGHVGAGSFGQGVASVQGNVTGSVASVTVVDDKVDYALSTPGLAAVWDVEAETGFSFKGLMRLMASALVGKSSGGGKTFRDLPDTKPRITATTDGSGNRTAVTKDVTD
jgi:hypothetical protein